MTSTATENMGQSINSDINQLVASVDINPIGNEIDFVGNLFQSISHGEPTLAWAVYPVKRGFPRKLGVDKINPFMARAARDGEAVYFNI